MQFYRDDVNEAYALGHAVQSHEANCIDRVYVVVSMNVNSATVSAMRDDLAKASYTAPNSLKCTGQDLSFQVLLI